MRGHGLIVWLTGPPASGKSTLGEELAAWLRAADRAVLWLDSDELRRVLTPRPTYSDEERDWFYTATGELALLAARGGTDVVISATGAQRRYRDGVRRRARRFVEVWVHADEQILRARDPKGLYARSDAGELCQLPGIDTPYEPPIEAEIAIDTGAQSSTLCFAQLASDLQRTEAWRAESERGSRQQLVVDPAAAGPAPARRR